MKRSEYRAICAYCSAPTTSRQDPPKCKPCHITQRRSKPGRSCSDCGGKIGVNTRGERCNPCYQKVRFTPVPADFAQQAKVKRAFGLIDHYGISMTMLRRWTKETGIMPLREGQRPVPPDFEAKVGTMLQAELAIRYSVDRRVIQRWSREVGIPPRPYNKRTEHPKPKLIPRPAAYAGPKSAFVGILPHDSTLDGRAADHLRCATRAAIYRCSEKGRADQKGRFWRFGNVVLTRDELLARAERHGFTTRLAA